LKFPAGGEEGGVEEIMEEEVIIEEEETREGVEAVSAVEEVVGEIIEDPAVAVEVVEIEVNTAEGEVEEEVNIEGVGEEGHPAEVEGVIERERGRLTEEETDMRAEVHLRHLPIVGRENTIERKEEGLLPEMGHQEDPLLQEIAMAHPAEIMEDPPLPGHPDDPMRAADPVAAGMKRATPAGDLLPHQGLTDTEAGAQWPAGTLLHTQVGLDQEKGILPVQAIQARAEALEQVEQIIEGEDPVMRVGDTRIMIEVTGDTAVEEEVGEHTSHPLELLLAKTILHPEVKGEASKKGGREGLQGTTVKTKSEARIQISYKFQVSRNSLSSSQFRIQMM